MQGVSLFKFLKWVAVKSYCTFYSVLQCKVFSYNVKSVQCMFIHVHKVLEKSMDKYFFI